MTNLGGPSARVRELAEEVRHAMRAGDLAAAETAAERALSLAPGLAPLANLLGLVRLGQARFADAEALFARAADADRRCAEFHANRGIALKAMGRLDDALQSLRRASTLSPADPQILHNLGNVLFAVERLDDATAVLRKAAALAPHWSAPRVKLGDALLKRGHVEPASEEYAQALADDPASPDAMAGLAYACYRLGEFGRAEELYDKALAAGRRDAAMLSTLGTIANVRGDLARAERCLREAVAADPAQSQARMNLAALLLLDGRLEEGWAEYRGRSARAALVLEEGALVGALTDLPAGGRVVLRGEQGLGDELFFLRWLPALRARGFGPVLRLDPRLMRLLERSPDVSPEELVHPLQEAAIGVVAVGDLPLLLVDGDRHPPTLRLAPDAAAVTGIDARLRALGPPPYVGVAWRAGTPPESQGAVAALLSKAIPLGALSQALRGLSSTLVSVQRLPAPGETEALAGLVGTPVHDLSDVNADLEQSLALMARLDDYVGVSSTNVHLRHACGRTSRVLVPNPPEWRWGREGESPWFSGTRVYREVPGRGWDEAVMQLRADLRTGLPSPPIA